MAMQVNAVFEGGGVKAIALAGAVKEAQRRGIEFHKVAGTSSGSIIAAMIAAGYTGDEMKAIIMQTPFSAFLKRSFLHRIRLVGPILRLLTKKGLYPGDRLERWIYHILLTKGVRTFADYGKDQVRIIASDISQGKLMVLPDDFPKYGLDPSLVPVAKAIRMSTSIPFFFDPVIFKMKDQSIYVVDGGLLSNFPLWLFDEKKENPGRTLPTLGFQLVGRGGAEAHAIHGPLTMLQALFATMMDAHDERYIEEHNRLRTIKIPTLGVSTTQFDISPEMSLALFRSGEEAAAKFFDKWPYSCKMNIKRKTE
jgi:NTE family protein